MLIDFHTHSFPDALAPRAMEALKQNYCGVTAAISAHTDGTVGGAENLLRKFAVDKAVICNIATNAKQQSKVNDHAISLLGHSFFVPLGSIHPDSENKADELDRLIAAGIKGVKLHADYAGVELSDPRYDEILSLVSERDIFAIVHTGMDPGLPDKVHATPEMLLGAVTKYKNLKLIAAHMGGFKKSSEVLSLLVGTNIYFDTSLSSIREPEWGTLYKILENHDEDRILFGTDTPWTDPAAEIAFVENAPISREKKDKIFYKNAEKLLNL